MAESRIDMFTDALREAVGDCFDVKAERWRDGQEVRRYLPRYADAADITIVDFRNSWFMTITDLGRFWDDNEEFLGWCNDETGQPVEPGFAEATGWAIDTCVNVARFGVARFRPRWSPIGRWSDVLTSEHAVDDLLAAHPRHKLVKRWHPW